MTNALILIPDRSTRICPIFKCFQSSHQLSPESPHHRAIIIHPLLLPFICICPGIDLRSCLSHTCAYFFGGPSSRYPSCVGTPNSNPALVNPDESLQKLWKLSHGWERRSFLSFVSMLTYCIGARHLGHLTMEGFVEGGRRPWASAI